jgi:heptosyltransferase-3
MSHFEWREAHRVEKDFYSVSEFLPLGETIPDLVFDRTRTARWPGADHLKDFALMHVGTRQDNKKWRVEAWIETARHLLTRVDHVVLTTGPNAEEADVARAIKSAAGDRIICTLGQTSWAQLADLLYRARIMVTLDTAAMHLAAACKTPVVALFGPSIEENWHPWNCPHLVVTNREFKKEPGADLGRVHSERPTTNIQVEDVIAAADRLLDAADTTTRAEQTQPAAL